MSLTRVGGDLLKQPLNIGTGVTITPDGNATFSGIVTAGNLVGSDGKPIASGAGLGTAVVAGSDEGGEQIYYTNTVLNITDNLTIDPPDSANASYTQYQEVAVEQGKDLIVEDDFIVDVLGISSSVATPLPGQGGRVRADRFTNKAGTGAPEFPNGVTISAGSTVTGDFGVSGDLLVGNDLTVSGSKTYLNTNSVEFKDKNIGIASVSTGKLTDGQLNGAGFTIYGLNGDKSLTWDNPNDRMAFSTDLYAPNVTADGSITVGDKFINSSGVGLGTISTAGRNAGINTAVGTLIYNADTNKTEVFGSDGWVQVGGSDYIEATGGTITELTEGDVRYNVHTFNSTEDFVVVSANNTELAEVQYLLVGGGGGGGGSRANGNGSGGGGAGGHIVGSTQVSAGTYTVTVGAGGNGGAAGSPSVPGSDGQNTTIAGPDITTITASGGGGGASGADGPIAGSSGGSGGGGGSYSGLGGSGTSGQGNAGGTASSSAASPAHPQAPNYRGGGGGGAGQRGSDGNESQGTGGKGLYSSIDGTNTIRAGGGGGGSYSPYSGHAGGAGGGGAGGGPTNGSAGTTNTGGGGGGASWAPTTAYSGGNGGSGVAIIRYITSGRQSAAATGGSVSFYNGKTIHAFTGTGTFTTPASFNKTCEYVVVGGGGAGGPSGGQTSGGGGAGGYLTGTTPVSGANTITITVGGGGYHGESYTPTTTTNPGSHSIAAFPAGDVRSEGGGGGNGFPTPSVLMSGGSGGGSGNGSSPTNGGDGTGGAADRVAGTNTPATPGQGNPGGPWTSGRGAGGGGAGAAGQTANAASSGAYGGIGVLLPATFTSPFVNVGHTGHAPGNHYVAGGGGGGGSPSGSGAYGATWDGSAGVGPGPWNSGAGRGGNGSESVPVLNGDGYMDAKASTGSGGGGNYAGGRSGSGGSGVVLIAYPT